MQPQTKPDLKQMIQETWNRWYLEGVTQAHREGLKEGFRLGMIVGTALALLVLLLF